MKKRKKEQQNRVSCIDLGGYPVGVADTPLLKVMGQGVSVSTLRPVNFIIFFIVMSMSMIHARHAAHRA